MLFKQSVPFIKEFVEKINTELQKNSDDKLSRAQKTWLAFCITGILLTNTINWAKFERSGLKTYSVAALSWMFRHSKINWERLLYSSIKNILRRYDIKNAVLAIDDTEKKRAKTTKKIHKVHKVKDKKTGGWFMGQSIVFLVLISPKITLPAGFRFYMPDPELTKWHKKKRKKEKNLGKKPIRRPEYPTKQELSLYLLQKFAADFPEVHIRAVLADSLYCTGHFLNNASDIFGGTQVISQLRKNQKIRWRNKEITVQQYFASHPGTSQTLHIRGDKERPVIMGSARLYVRSHSQKRFVIAIKYEGETEYRYLAASDMTWRTQDIAQTFTLRWLIEVFIQDWKSYEGWKNMSKQQGEKGSGQSLILSLLADHAVLLHPEFTARIENKLPALTVGSIIEKVKAESLLSVIQDILVSDNPQSDFELFRDTLFKTLNTLTSKKHMITKFLGRMEPTPALKYKI